MRDHAVSVFIISPQGVPLVNDPRKSSSLWKCPGGKGEGNESPVDTAVREIREETGISLDPLSLTQIYRADKGTHDKYAFVVYLDELPPLKKVGDEGEMVAVWQLDEMYEAVDILPSHYFEFIEPVLRSVLNIPSG